MSRDFDAWSEAAARVGHCARPIRLHGSSQTVDTRRVRCSRRSPRPTPARGAARAVRKRRAADCPSCSRLYAADTFHLIRAGVTGGKGVPEHGGRQPLVFATLTAPSFGLVHGTRGGRTCRPFTTKGQERVCPHGRPTVCHARHADGDELLGQPLCRDCYDYAGHVVWQWWAPELWRRFTIDLRRALAKTLGVPERRLAGARDGAVREGRRVPAARHRPLPRPDPPRRTPNYRRVRTRACGRHARRAGPGRGAGRRCGVVRRAAAVRG